MSANPHAHLTADRQPENNWLRTLIIFCATLAVYLLIAWWADNLTSPTTAYFDQLADAWLHGRLHLIDPAETQDLTQHDGRWYVPFPPLATILLLPWVAIAGIAGVSTVVFSAVCGAIGVATVDRWLLAARRAGLITLPPSDIAWLTTLLALGSPLVYVAVDGGVWFVAQTTTTLMTGLAAWAALTRRSAWIAASLLALAMLGRPHVVLLWPLLIGLAVQRDGMMRLQWTPAVRRWIAGSLPPLIIAVTLLALHNFVRFGDATDFGYVTQNIGGFLKTRMERWGQFHVAYIPQNLHTLLVGLPRYDAGLGAVVPSLHGMSLLLTTPATVLVAWSLRRRREPAVAGAWVSIALVLVPLLMYYNTGWQQFGYRFSLDFVVALVLLIAVGAGGRLSRTAKGLIVAGILVHAWGVGWWFDLLRG